MVKRSEFEELRRKVAIMEERNATGARAHNAVYSGLCALAKAFGLTFNHEKGLVADAELTVEGLLHKLMKRVETLENFADRRIMEELRKKQGGDEDHDRHLELYTEFAKDVGALKKKRGK